MVRRGNRVSSEHCIIKEAAAALNMNITQYSAKLIVRKSLPFLVSLRIESIIAVKRNSSVFVTQLYFIFLGYNITDII